MTSDQQPSRTGAGGAGAMLPPVVGPADAWKPASASFTCDRCGEVAGTVTLVPPLAADPLAPPPGAPGAIPGAERLFGDTVRIAVDGPIPVTQAVYPAAGKDIGALDAAIRAGDVQGIYAVDPEFASFLCPHCGKCYCKARWVTWVTFADDYPGWYEDTKGRCPEGHVRIMDD